MKTKILQILNSEAFDVLLEDGDNLNVIEKEDFDDIAERIVKLFAIHNVVGSAKY